MRAQTPSYVVSVKLKPFLELPLLKRPSEKLWD